MTRHPVRPELLHWTQPLDFHIQTRAACRIPERALCLFIAHADRFGVPMMVSWVVLYNNQSTLDPEEFRGLALSNKQAPLASTPAGRPKRLRP